jgi:hypothetical protein
MVAVIVSQHSGWISKAAIFVSQHSGWISKAAIFVSQHSGWISKAANSVANGRQAQPGWVRRKGTKLLSRYGPADVVALGQVAAEVDEPA